MNIIGIIVEYNPFHNGHLYQINKIKDKYKDSLIIVIMSSSFTERGEISILDKWTKTDIALKNNIDIVLELPYVYSSQSSDIFAKGAVGALNELKIDTICFGSESKDIDKLTNIAKAQLNNNKFDQLVKKYLDEGSNYPTSVNKALKTITGYEVKDANDLLNISYIKEILKLNRNINIDIIKRTNEFHDLKSKNKIISASNIRNKMLNNENIKSYVPKSTYKYLKNINLKQIEYNYFKYLKYKILTNIDNLNTFNTVDEGIENKIKKVINISKNTEELINNVKSKRYTYNKIRRMFTHILVDFTKEDNKIYTKFNYIRILGFSPNGKLYLNKIKKNINVKVLTNFDKELLNYESKITSIYSLITENEELIEKEYKNKPLML